MPSELESQEKQAPKIDDNESIIRSANQSLSRHSTPIAPTLYADSPSPSDFVLSELEIRALKSPCPT